MAERSNSNNRPWLECKNSRPWKTRAKITSGITTQSKLTNFGLQNVELITNQTSKDVSKESSFSSDAGKELTASQDEMNKPPGDKAEIMAAMKNIKFSGRFDGIMTAMEMKFHH